MDLVSRLKRYLDSKQISVTQFADECAIPRPTGSQLLAGRNKKVSDEIISKIHLAYPDLNIVWLMFGEGNMVNNANIEISEPQNSANSESYSDESPDNQAIDFSLDFNENLQDEVAEKNSEPAATNTFTFASPADSPTEPLEFTQQIGDEAESHKQAPPTPKSSGKGKRVTGIVVYYDDCTYESFIPDPNHGHPFMR